MVFKSNSQLNTRNLILLTPGFEEGTAVFCLEKMRRAGLPVSLISLSHTPVRGLHGISIQPDGTLDDISTQSSFRLLLLSGGKQYVSSLLVDPRFHQLYQKSEMLAATAETESILTGAHFPIENGHGPIVSQGKMNAIDFADHLVGLLHTKETAISETL